MKASTLALLATLVVTPMAATAGTITVFGQAELEKPADQARVVATVQVTEQSVQGAKTKVDKVIASALTAIKKAKISAGQYKAATIQLSPQYNYRSEQREFIGYQASRSIELTVPAEQVGQWLQQFSELGFNQLNSPQYNAEITDADRNKLLQQAVRDALAKANILAKASSQTVGEVVEVEELSNNAQPRPMARMAMADESSSYHGGHSRAQMNVKVVVETKS